MRDLRAMLGNDALNRVRAPLMDAAWSILCRIGKFYRGLGIFGAGFIVGGTYCSTLAALGKEAIARLTGVAL